MSSCINKTHPDFKNLQAKSGLSESELNFECSYFQDKYGRFPELDELQNANSRPYLEKQLDIKDGGAKIDNILNMTGAEDIPSAQVILNDKFRDQEIRLFPLTNEAIVDITKRPVNGIPIGITEHNKLSESAPLFANIITKLTDLYGIQLNQITMDDLANTELGQIPGVANAKAFIHNGQIYINTDFADKDAPIHEMMHILMGQIRKSDPDLYYSVVQQVSKSPIMNQYRVPNRTESDIAEEAFVEEFARLATGLDTKLTELPDNIKYELMYNAKRVLDSILMGEVSVNSYSNPVIFNSSLSDMCELVNSKIDERSNLGTLSYDNIYNMLSNKKSELMEQNELEEICNA